MNPYNVLKRPVVTEKSDAIRDESGRYTFVIDRDATKDDVKKALSIVYQVSAIKVNTTVRRGKETRYKNGKWASQAKPTKRAYVQLAAGQTINLFENQEA